jgi:hypothetical protein
MMTVTIVCALAVGAIVGWFTSIVTSRDGVDGIWPYVMTGTIASGVAASVAITRFTMAPTVGFGLAAAAAAVAILWTVRRATDRNRDRDIRKRTT